MPRIGFLRPLASAVGLLLIGAAPAAAQQNSAAERAATLGDSIETRTRPSSVAVSYGVAEAVVSASLDEVLEAITAYGAYASFVPNLRTSRVLSRRGDNAIVYFEATAMRNTLTFWAEARLYSRPPRGETRIIEGRMREGNLEHFVARWEITPVDDDRTLVELHMLFMPNLPFGSGLLTAENVRTARKTVRNLRQRVGGG